MSSFKSEKSSKSIRLFTQNILNIGQSTRCRQSNSTEKFVEFDNPSKKTTKRYRKRVIDKH